MTVIGVLAGLFSWIVSAMFHAFILRDGPLGMHIFSPRFSELWHRLALAVCFVGLGAYAQSLLVGRWRAERAFRQSEERSRILLDNISDGILIADAETGKFVEVNKMMCDMLGYSREEIMDLGIEDIHPPADLPAVIAGFRQRVKNNERFGENLPVMRKDGTVFYADIGHTTLTLNGRKCGAGIFRDITERRQAEEETERLFQELAQKAVSLKESEARFRSIAEMSIDVIFRLDLKGLFTYVSPTVVRTFGFAAGDILGKHFLEFVHQDDRRSAIGVSRALLRGKEVRSLELRIVKMNGRFLYGEINIVPVMRASAIAEIHGVFHDITGRKEMENRIRGINIGLERRIAERTAELEITDQALKREIAERARTQATLRESWTRFQQLAENIREIFWIWDVPGRQFLYISPAYEQVWGRTCESLYDQPDSFLECVHQEDAPRVSSSATRQEVGTPFDEEFRIIRPDSSIRWVWARAFSIPNEQGEISRFVGIAEDITDRKSAEQLLRTHADQLQVLSSRLIEAREAERRFIARELHDEIGQQLTGVKMTLDMMMRSVPDSLTVQMQDAQSLIAGLLKQVRELSLELRPSMLDDLGLLPALTWHFDRYRSQTGISVAFTHDGLERRLDPVIETALYRVVQESLTNAARHADTREVSVSLALDGTDLRLSVADCGAGFDPGEVRARTMGLFGMRERVEALGGSLAIQSAPGAGTMVTATVPLRDAAGGNS